MHRGFKLIFPKPRKSTAEMPGDTFLQFTTAKTKTVYLFNLDSPHMSAKLRMRIPTSYAHQPMSAFEPFVCLAIASGWDGK